MERAVSPCCLPSSFGMIRKAIRKAALFVFVACGFVQLTQIGRVLIGTPLVDLPNNKESTTTTACSWPTNSSCRQELATRMQRIWPRKIGWQSKHNSTLLLVKVPKSASSTLAGIALRLQALHGIRADWQHQNTKTEPRSKKSYNRDPESTFLVAPVRDPDSRALSSVYFHRFSFHNIRFPSDEMVERHLHAIPDNYITDYVRLNDETNLLEAVSEVVAKYDFLLVFDRLEESIVLWSWLAGVPLTSFLLAKPSKLSGTWYLAGKKCRSTRPLSSNSNMRSVSGIRLIRPPRNNVKRSGRHLIDKLLYDISNRSLQATIEYAGDDFRTRWEEYKIWKQIIAKNCAGNETRFPCDDNGQPSTSPNCYLRDFGCGYPCVDRVVLDRS